MILTFCLFSEPLNLFKMNIDNVVQKVQCALKNSSTELVKRVSQYFRGK